jgi:diguanylate cyclase
MPDDPSDDMSDAAKPDPAQPDHPAAADADPSEAADAESPWLDERPPDAPDPGRALDRLSRAIDGHMTWFARWSEALFFPGEAPKIDPPPGLHEWAAMAGRHPVVTQPAVERLIGLHDDLHARAMALCLRSAVGQRPSAEEFGRAAALFADVMGQMRRLERGLALARYGVDPLTGLRARHGMRDDLEQVAAGARGGDPAAVVVADVDRLRGINAGYGPEAGDRVIVAAFQALVRHLGPRDEAYRCGDDAALAVLRGCDAAAAAQRAERMRREVQATPVPLEDGRVVRMSMSFGLIQATADLAADDLLLGAETAMRQAKSAGRNRVVRARAVERSAEGQDG